MELLLALVAGVLYAAGMYLMLRRRLAQLIIGLGLLSNGSNLLIFPRPASPAAGRRSSRRRSSRGRPYADPVPQALILTAIVIGFGVLAFSLVLAHRVHASVGTDDIDAIGPDRGDAAGAPDPGAARRPRSCCICCRNAAGLLRLVAFAGALAPPGRRRRRLRPRAARRHSGAADRRLAGAVRHHPGRRPARAILVVMVGVVGVAVTGSSFAGVDPRREAFGYHPLIQIAADGRLPARS